MRLALLFVLVFAVFMPGAVAANEYEGYGSYDEYEGSGFGDGGYIGIEPAIIQMWRDFGNWGLNMNHQYVNLNFASIALGPIYWSAPFPITDPLYIEISYSNIQHNFPEGWVPVRNTFLFGLAGRPDLQFLNDDLSPAPLYERAPGVFRFTFPSAYSDPPGVPLAPMSGFQPSPAFNVWLRPIPPTIEKRSFPVALPLLPGDIVEYQLTIANPAIVPNYGTAWSGLFANFNNHRVTDTLPLGLAMHSLPHEVVVNGTIGGSAGYNVTITHDSISGRDTLIVDLDLPGANQAGAGGELGLVTITFQTIVTADAPECDFIINRAYLTFPGDDPNDPDTWTLPPHFGQPYWRPAPPRDSVNNPPIYAVDPNPPFVGGDCDEPPPPPCRDYINPEFEITKNLRLPTGAVPPNRDFEFEIRLVDLWFFEPIRPLPDFTIIERSIPFSNTMTTLSGTATFDFNHVDWFAMRPNPGFYTFQVREIVPTPSTTVETDGITVYDTNVFYVFLQVGWICDGEDDLGIMFARTQRWTHCGDPACPTTANHDPIWPCEAANCTMDGLCADCTPCVECGWDKGGDIIFENDFIPLSPLEIRKQVTGNFGSRNSPFDMSIRLTLPQLVPNAVRGPITGGIYRYGSTTRVPIPNILIDITLGSETTPREGFFEFELRHGDRLVLDNIPIGTTYTVTEYFVTAYNQSAFITEAGITGGEITAPRLPPRQDLLATGTMRQRWVAGAVEGTGTINSDNSVLVVNHQDQAPPLGVFVDNAPFVGLIVLAGISGVLGFMRLRKREYEDDIV